MNVAQAMQEAFDFQRELDLLTLHPWSCTPLSCARSWFWRDRAMHAEEEADRYARQLVLLGEKPEPRKDGCEA